MAAAAGKPVLFYAAVGEDGKALKLTASPDAFSEILRREQTRVATEADAVSLARLWFETTRPTGIPISRAAAGFSVLARGPGMRRMR